MPAANHFGEADKQRLSAERREAIVEGRPYAIPIDCPFEASMGAPYPTLLQSENQAFLFFYLEGDEDRVARVTFERTWSTKFGEPDENGIMDHPLIGSGLDGVRPMQVINSAWIAELIVVTKVHGVTAENFSGRHFIFPFHDSTFECVANSFSVEVVGSSIADAVAQADPYACKS